MAVKDNSEHQKQIDKAIAQIAAIIQTGGTNSITQLDEIIAIIRKGEAAKENPATVTSLPLHPAAQKAIDELRESLKDIRAALTPKEPKPIYPEYPSLDKLYCDLPISRPVQDYLPNNLEDILPAAHPNDRHFSNTAAMQNFAIETAAKFCLVTLVGRTGSVPGTGRPVGSAETLTGEHINIYGVKFSFTIDEVYHVDILEPDQKTRRPVYRLRLQEGLYDKLKQAKAEEYLETFNPTDTKDETPAGARSGAWSVAASSHLHHSPSSTPILFTAPALKTFLEFFNVAKDKDGGLILTDIGRHC